MKANLLRPKEPAKYDGSSKYSELNNWLHSVDMFLAAKDMHESREAIKYVATLLSGPAATWWRYHRIAAANGTAMQITYWDEFQRAMLAHFRPEDAERMAREKLLECTQMGPVRDYNSRFQMLMLELPEMNEKDRLFSYLTGLETTIRLQVELQYPKTLRVAMELAEISDSTLFCARQGAKFGHWGEEYSPEKQRNRQDDEDPRIWIGEGEHYSLNQAANIRRIVRNGKETRTCFYCGQVGHLKANCETLKLDVASRQEERDMEANAIERSLGHLNEESSTDDDSEASLNY